jgi:hypothetical protein
VPAELAEWLQALAATPFAAYLRESSVAYATLNAAHIFSIGIIIGSIAALDLRALGLFRNVPFAALALPLVDVSAAGVALAIVTGLLLFSVRPLAYAENPAFLIKVSLGALGVVNALVLRGSRSWRDAVAGEPIADSVRAAALRSLLIWAGAVLAGRWIGFLQ